MNVLKIGFDASQAIIEIPPLSLPPPILYPTLPLLMKIYRILPLAAVSVLILTACTGSLTSEKVTYDLSFNVTDTAQIENLTNAAMRVVERRLDAMGVVNPGKELDLEAKTIEVTLPDADGVEELTRQLTSPFTMSVMKQTASGAIADITVEKFGGFSKTNVTEMDFIGVEVGQDSNRKTRARIIMTEAGRAKLNEIFKTENGKNIGIFVRDRLISQLAVNAASLTDDLQIQGIPNLLIAEAFSDDVNVGLHVDFTPKP